MSRMEIAIERLRALPEDEHDAFAAEVEALLAEPASTVTSEQWELVDAELAASEDGANLSHATVVARMRGQFGR